MMLKIKSEVFPGKYLYANFRNESKSETLVIFMSGLSGSKNLPLFKKAEPFFCNKGFDTLRINFCHEDEDGEKKSDSTLLRNMSLSVYSNELRTVIDHFLPSYSKIILVGHSFGAIISLFFLNKHKKFQKNTSLVLWDQTFLPWPKKTMEKVFNYDPKKKTYSTSKGEFSINKTLYQEFMSIDSVSLASKLNVPVCIIAAKGSGDKDARKYYKSLKNKAESEIHIISGTGHMFGSKIAQKKLFDKTIEYLSKALS